VTQSLDAAAHVGEIARMHGIAAEVLGLGEAKRAAQAKYIAQVSRQLQARSTAFLKKSSKKLS
jgi:hypothetical protein